MNSWFFSFSIKDFSRLCISLHNILNLLKLARINVDFLKFLPDWSRFEIVCWRAVSSLYTKIRKSIFPYFPDLPDFSYFPSNPERILTLNWLMMVRVWRQQKSFQFCVEILKDGQDISGFRFAFSLDARSTVNNKKWLEMSMQQQQKLRPDEMRVETWVEETESKGKQQIQFNQFWNNGFFRLFSLLSAVRVICKQFSSVLFKTKRKTWLNLLWFISRYHPPKL